MKVLDGDARKVGYCHILVIKCVAIREGLNIAISLGFKRIIIIVILIWSLTLSIIGLQVPGPLSTLLKILGILFLFFLLYNFSIVTEWPIRF